MALPKAVQKHAEDLEQLEQQLQAPAEGDTPDGQTGDVGESNASVGESDVPRDEPSGGETATQPETDAQGDTESSNDDESKWEHKYRRLQGKYDAEVPRLHSEVRELKQMLQQIQAEKAQAQQAQSQSDAEQSEQKSRDPLVTDKDVEAFGDDLIDLQRRVAKEVAGEFQQELGKLRHENEQLRQQMTQTQGATFETRLVQAIPDFQQINTDPRWVAWLDEFDPMIQGPRRAVAEAAYHRGDVEAVKAYVDLFKQTVEEPKPAQPKSEVKPDRQAELQRQVQPTKSSAPAPNPNAGGRVISSQEFERGMNRAAKLMREGRFDEAAALESEMSTAVAEGRVAVQ